MTSLHGAVWGLGSPLYICVLSVTQRSQSINKHGKKLFCNSRCFFQWTITPIRNGQSPITLSSNSANPILILIMLWCDQAKWVGTHKHWFLDSQKAKGSNFFVSYCFYNPSTVCIFGTNWPLSIGFVAKGSFENDVTINQKNENWIWSTSSRHRQKAWFTILQGIIFTCSIFFRLLQLYLKSVNCI